MAYGTTTIDDGRLICVLLRRLGRLVRLKRTLGDASPRARHRADLVHAATRSTLVDLARLDQADLAMAVLARGRRGRQPGRAAREQRHPTTANVLNDATRR